MKNDTIRIEIFALALLKKSDSYGYELTENIKRVTKGHLGVKEGTLYPILHSALKDGYITSYDKIVGKKIRVYYHITDVGKQHLIELVENYKKVLTMIDNIME